MTDEKKTREELAHDAEVARLTKKRDAAVGGTLAYANREYQLAVCAAEGDVVKVSAAQRQHAAALEELQPEPEPDEDEDEDEDAAA